MKANGRKLKALHIREILLSETDSEHSLNASEIIEKLEKRGIKAERKSIYGDIEALREEGFIDVVSEGSRSGYRVASRDFDIAELKMLVDAVQSCRFISKNQSASLIKKLSSLASVHEARGLSRGVYIYDRTEDTCGNIFYKIDKIHEAISEERALEFVYTEVAPDKSRHEKKDGRAYKISPFSLIWQEENYYLVGFDHGLGAIRHYRVDRMEQILVLDEKRTGAEFFEKVNLASYCKSVFGMFGGDEVSVKFRAENKLAGALFDRFGYSLPVKHDGDSFEFYANVVPSVRFFGWVFGFDGALSILSPKNVVEDYREQIKRVCDGLKIADNGEI